MNRETSIYLDLVRFSAAMVVMIGHLSGARFAGGLFWQLGQFMDDAVVIFFVLSGFVIAYVVDQKETNVEKYAIARAARIYSVALPALMLTFVLDALGKNLAPHLYSAVWGYDAENLIGQFFAGLFFVNQLWYAPIQIGSMLPYWSLGFEVWYYVFFAIIYFVKSCWKYPLLIAACLVTGPRLVAFFPLWMMGYGAYKFAAVFVLSRKTGTAMLGMSIFAYGAYCLMLKDWLLNNPILYSSLGLLNLAPRYIVGTLFAIHLIAFVWASKPVGRALLPFASTIQWFAGATFTIYLFHIPVAQFLITMLPWPPADWRSRLIVLAGTFVLMLVIAEFTERKKRVWVGWISMIVAWLKARTSQPADGFAQAPPEEEPARSVV